VQILFTSAKNDKYRNGQVTILPANNTTLCPVRLTKIYFNAMGLRPGIDGQDTKHLHCRLPKLAGRWMAAEGGPASISKGREELKELLREAGRQGRGITDKSFKMLGITRMMEAGGMPSQAAQHGWWRSKSMPLRYKHNLGGVQP
jgi:hypothetical protein